MQEEGVAGRLVGGMIRRSVRRTFRGVYWIPPRVPITTPVILVPNHHGWHDGYLMFHVIQALRVRCLDWIAEFDAFPLFAKVGGMPFPPNDVARRAGTIRRTIRLMRDEGRSLILFAEGVLHYPPQVLSFGRSLEVVAKSVESCSIRPVGIKYEMSLHERPEAFILIGDEVARGSDLARRCRDAVQVTLAEAAYRIRQDETAWTELVRGKRDINERWDMRGLRERP